MTDIPTAALLLCGTSDIRLQSAALAGDILKTALKSAGISVNAHYALRLTPSAADAAQITLAHFAAVSDLVITVGGAGFGESDVMPDILLRLCEKRADYFAGILCGAAPLPCLPEPPQPPSDALPPFIPAAERRAREKQFLAALTPSAVLSRLLALPYRTAYRSKPEPYASCPTPRRIHPSRAAAGIRHTALLLNFPDDVSDARLLIDALLPSVCAGVFRLCGKCAVPVNVCDDLVNSISLLPR